MTNKLSTPFAINSTLRNDVPITATTAGEASYNIGFPPENFKTISNGGIAVDGKDFNGLFFDITGNIVDINKGLPQYYDDAYATLIGGYPVGARLVLNDNSGFVVSTISNNQNNPNTNISGWRKIEELNVLSIINTTDDLQSENVNTGKLVYVRSRLSTSNYALSSPFVGGGHFICVQASLNPDGGKVFSSNTTGYYWVRVCQEGFYDVTWYGAVQDSTTDNTAIIQGILDIARPQNQSNVSNLSKFGTATVYFPSSNVSYYYYATELHIPSFVTLQGEATGNALKGTTMYLRSDVPSTSTTLYYNMNFSLINLNFKQCKLNLFSKETASQSAGFMIIKLTNVYFDGADESGAGNTTGDCITVKNVTFDVHLDKVYVNGYTGHCYGVISDNQLGGGIGYLATGVFCTLNQCKFMNSGYGMYLQGAAADSTDIHCNNVLLDHNNIGAYIDGTRQDGMGELHVYFDSGRIEWSTNEAFKIIGPATVMYKGWLMAPSSEPDGGNRIYLGDPSAVLSIDGRFNGYASGVGYLKFSSASIINGFQKSSDLRVLSSRNQLFLSENIGESVPTACVSSTFVLTLSGSDGFTLQALGSGVQGGVWWGGISYGLTINKSATSAITANSTTTSIGTSGGRDYLGVGYDVSNKLIELKMGNYNCDFVGFENIKSNSTGTALNLCVNISNAFTPQISFTDLTGKNVDLLTLKGSIMFSFTNYLR